jgi:hypothetical protein
VVPIDKVMPAGAQTVFIIGSAVGFALIWSYAIRESFRRRDWIPVLVVAGCGAAIFYEPLGDQMAHVYYTERGQISWIHAFGRHIPLFVGLLYFWYMSIGTMWLLRANRTGVSARNWWTAWGGFLVFALALEMVSAKGFADANGAPWIYYGHQAFKLLGVPIFTPFSYISIDIPIALGACAAAHWLPRRMQWLVLPGTPMLMVAGHAMTALPSAVANNSTNSTVLLDIGALGTAAFALILSYCASLAFRRPWGPDRSELDRLWAGGEHAAEPSGPLATVPASTASRI